MPINHQPWKASSSNRAVGRGATRPRSAPGNEGPLVVKRGRTCECCPHWHPATSRRVPGRRAGRRSAVLLQVFAPERAVAVSALAGDPSPSLSTARDRRRHRLVARRRSRRPPADETNNPTPDPRLTRGMSKLVTRAASRARHRPTRGRHLAPIPASHHRVRPVPRGPPRRRRNATDVASTSSSSLAPSPRVSTRRRPPRDRSPRADDAVPPLSSADAPPRAPLGRNRARTRRPVRAHRPRTQGAPSRAGATRRRTQGGTRRPRPRHGRRHFRSPARLLHVHRRRT